ncbi:hypothetical protein DCAR_0832688 [Daucus carota subsp. sativus]|uniref:Pentacotripeptide-repeat region of PRORP domain-containing protein n=1 Tax=Daucus carota subsp. sativus TaxID=79200 RepID=A0A175YQ02_DAUCS|nr:PREDICTED: putative pentatricopeptide repeat-containing protein At5g08310, mitochondrial [Daucus carota subsp. sativus]XP_017220300.1 PREDICTED: putative pentatricopeptide repeat-containing protein At5g08310, mitochondrial [Daucus carota subsp. sativus]XP_017220301.1 PREDICTED: putative pentatricopeptide repeat-containing protein At5g08310, mitochondrial [Daucus carota subsp. sativus]XP_017220303.1 PREDICTED: putative pentatricopeptide repeat-containing protein At5g08310, mitochondrial [Daucu
MSILRSSKNLIFLKSLNLKIQSLLLESLPHNHTLKFSHTLFSSSSSEPIDTNNNEIVDKLIHVFTKQPHITENQELVNLGHFITPKIVESVLISFKNWKIALEFFNWASSQSGYRHNAYTFNAMASILSGVRQNAQLKALAAELGRSGCFMSPGAMGFFIRCLGKVGLVEDAVLLFDRFKVSGFCVPNGYTYNCLIEVMAKSCEVEVMEMRLKEMTDTGWQPDKFTLTAVLQCYCNAKKFDKALDVYNVIGQSGWLDTRVLSILVLSFSKWGKVDEAVEMIERMEQLDIRLNEKTFYVLIHGFVKEGKIDKALQLLNKMLNLGILPEFSLYDVLVGALLRNKEFEIVLHLCRQMNELGISPDVQLLTKLLSSFPEEKDVIILFKQAKKTFDDNAIVLLYNSLLKGLVDNRAVEKAYHLLRTMIGENSTGYPEVEEFVPNMSQVHPDTNSYSIVINGLCQTANIDMALKLFHDMQLAGCKSDQLLYNNLIDSLSKSDRLEECYRLLKDMKESGLKPTHFTHNSIFGCLCRREDVGKAHKLLQEMRISGHEPWIKHSTLLVKKLCSNGKAIDACDFLNKMVLEGFVPNIIAYSAAIDGLFKIQEVDRALELFKGICARGYCPDVIAYNIVLKGLLKAERVLEAEDLLREMLKKDLVPSVVTYNLLIDSWCKNGEIDRAMECHSRMDGERREPNIITYTTLIDGLCNAGRSEDAMLLWNEMVRKGCHPNNIAYMAFIHGICKCGRPDEAFIYFQEMQDKQMTPDAFIYVALVEAFLSNSDAPSAIRILVKMAQDNKFPDPLDKNCVRLRDAVFKLSADARTSSTIETLLKEGSIPEFLNNSGNGN